MVRILDFNGQDAERSTTVGAIVALKSGRRKLVQVTASSAEEAVAAEAAEIDMIVCMAQSVSAVREGSCRLFVTAAIDFGGAVTLDDIVGAAFAALGDGADAVITARRLECVERLAKEDVPVMGHLGFVPKKASIYGGVRSVGKNAAEAGELFQQFRRLEDAGAFGVECELIPANVMAEINKRTELATVSLGSGPDADVMFLFSSDICGEDDRPPRHARSYGDVASLKAQIASERVKALSAFRADVRSGAFPDSTEIVNAADDQLRAFIGEVDEIRSVQFGQVD